MIHIPHHSDQRGQLHVVEWNRLPFTPQRVFWISNVPEGQKRGGHAHSQCAEVIFPVQGSFDIFIDDHVEQKTVHMDNPTQGVYVGNNVWCELSNFASGTIVLVLASSPYIKDGYIYDYQEFKSH